MENKQLMAAVEAVLFSSGEPLSLDRLAEAVEQPKDKVREVLVLLKDKYDNADSGISITTLADSYQMVSREEYAQYVKNALEIRRNAPLSQAAMEVLAIIAYNQPVSKSFIEQVRGIDSSQTVNNLVEKGLVEEAGRLDVPGRPIIYKTSLGFLRCFKIESLEQLPPLPDDSDQIMLDDIIQEAQEQKNDTEQ